MQEEETARRRCQTRVTAIEPLGEDLFRIDLEGAGVGAGAASGRFAMVEAPGRPDCVLMRPYSYFLAPGDDRIALLVKSIGKGTEALRTAEIGAPVAVLGPLGNRFPEPAGVTWAVAGGVGAAPFGAIAHEPGVKILFGARTKKETGFARALGAIGGSVEIATDDGTAGVTGTVVDLLGAMLERERPDAIHCCGPDRMMAAVAQVAMAAEIPCWVSLEERMGCGFGVCRGCAHTDAQGGLRCICEDGPVYPASTIYAKESADVRG